MRLMRAVKLNIKAEDCKFKNNELEAGGNCRAGDHSLQVQGWLHMHNLITMLVLFLEHHDKYCSRTIIETFEMSHFCKTRKKARKNMNMGEVILLTSKYDSPARQPKKNCNGYTLVPLVNALCLTYSVTTACSTCGHVVKRISRRSVDVDFEQQWLQGWLCACMILSQLFLML